VDTAHHDQRYVSIAPKGLNSLAQGKRSAALGHVSQQNLFKAQRAATLMATDPQRVIDESRPMLEDFLTDIGLHQAGSKLDLIHLLEPFSHWVDAQDIPEESRFYLASRLGAFICVYLIEACSGERVIEGDRILMRLPVQPGVWREFEPYAVAAGMATDRKKRNLSLSEFCSTAGR
jgi:hypothetical protein